MTYDEWLDLPYEQEAAWNQEVTRLADELYAAAARDSDERDKYLYWLGDDDKSDDARWEWANIEAEHRLWSPRA